MDPEEIRAVKIRQQLQKSFGNEHDNGFTYIDPSTGLPVRLSNVAIDIWVRAIVSLFCLVFSTVLTKVKMSGIATLTSPPPNDPLFQSSGMPLPRLSAHHRGRSSSTSDTSTSNSNDSTLLVLGHLGTIFSSLSNVATGKARQRSSSSSHSCSPPRRTVMSGSPPKITPTKLPRFLKHAESAGISNASSFEYDMRRLGYGPDILADVNDADLIKIGVPPGDVIRLKRFAPDWWGSADAKRKRVVADVDVPNKRPRVSFERIFKDQSGAARTYGTLEPSDDEFVDPEADWYYYSNAAQAMIPIPQGFMPVLPGDDDEDE